MGYPKSIRLREPLLLREENDAHSAIHCIYQETPRSQQKMAETGLRGKTGPKSPFRWLFDAEGVDVGNPALDVCQMLELRTFWDVKSIGRRLLSHRQAIGVNWDRLVVTSNSVSAYPYKQRCWASTTRAWFPFRRS